MRTYAKLLEQDLRVKFLLQNAYIRKQERAQVSDPGFYPKKNGKRNANQPKVSMRKEIIQTRKKLMK